MINRILMELYDDYYKGNKKSLLDFAEKTFPNDGTAKLFIGCTLILFSRACGFKARYYCTREELLSIVLAAKEKVGNSNLLAFYLDRVNDKKGINKYLVEIVNSEKLDKCADLVIEYLEQFKPKFIDNLKQYDKKIEEYINNKGDNKDLRTIYIPETHKKYDVLPTCRKLKVEMIVPDIRLLDKIEKLTGITDYMGLHPYQRFKSYEQFYDEIDGLINKFPNYEQEIIEYKKSVIKMNNKDLWAILQYIGKSNLSFTKNKYYYVVMYLENDSWIVEGIIDNEEYEAFLVWLPECTNPVNLNKDFKIIIDPSNNLENEFAKIMQNF